MRLMPTGSPLLDKSIPRDAQRDSSKRAIKNHFLRQRKGRETGYIDTYRYKEVAKEDIIGEKKKPSSVDQRLRRRKKAKAKGVGKGGRKAVDGDGKSRGGRGASIASKAFLPGETPMSPLCPGDDVLAGHQRVFLRWSGPPHHDCFAPDHREPVAAELTAWPVPPKDRSMRECVYGFGERRRCGDGGCRGNGLVRREGPEHSTDPSWFAGGRAFLTLSTQLALAAITDAGCIQQTIRAIALRSAFLRIERMIGGTEQASKRREAEKQILESHP